MSETESIKFDATVYGVRTLVDQGLRITFDLPEDAVTQAAQLMELKRIGVALQVSVIVKQTVSDYAISKRPDRKSKRTPPEIKGID